MANLPGNPYAEKVEAVLKSQGRNKYPADVVASINKELQRDATMALAFELRTANLIAVAVRMDKQEKTGDDHWEAIVDRIGPGETK